MKAHWRLLVLSTLVVAAIVSAGSTTRGEWTFVNLHPAGVQNSSALFGVADGQQVGYVGRNEDGLATPALWSGTADSYVSLNPPDSFGQAYGVSQGKQVGQVFLDGTGHAVIWNGAANSYVNLQPPGTYSSEVRGIRGNRQVGSVVLVGGAVSSDPHASLWTDTAASWVDLNPAGAVRSVAYGVDGNQQVGQATALGDHGRASLWTGTAASWVNLEPAPAPGVFPIVVSVANAVHDGQQGGTLTYRLPDGTLVDHGGYWNGTAESWVDLSIDLSNLFGQSRVNSLFGAYQVGQVETGFENDSSPHAGIWHGTPESWVDLDSFLPGNYIGSNAFGVWTDGQMIQVAGVAYNNTLGRAEAILWTNTVPEPASSVLLAIGLGALVCGRACAANVPATRLRHCRRAG